MLSNGQTCSSKRKSTRLSVDSVCAQLFRLPCNDASGPQTCVCFSAGVYTVALSRLYTMVIYTTRLSLRNVHRVCHECSSWNIQTLLYWIKLYAMRLCNERRERVYFIMARVPRRVPLIAPVYNDRREKTGNVCLYTILHVVKSLPVVWSERTFRRARIHPLVRSPRCRQDFFRRQVH